MLSYVSCNLLLEKDCPCMFWIILGKNETGFVKRKHPFLQLKCWVKKVYSHKIYNRKIWQLLCKEPEQNLIRTLTNLEMCDHEFNGNISLGDQVNIFYESKNY